jgi:hypothetical protein
MLRTPELLKKFQGTLFEMHLNERLTEEEFNFLSALSEGMESDSDAVFLSTILEKKYMKDKDLFEAIVSKDFKKAMKAQFNIILARCNIAEEFLNDESVSEERKAQWEPQFLKILEELNFLLKRIGEHTPDEVTNGFKI